jgi:intein/homing endonuclease
MKNKKISKKDLIKRVHDLELVLGRKPVKRDNGTLYTHARELFGSWNKLMVAAGYSVRFIQNVGSYTFDENLAYFLGLLITDGHIAYDIKRENYKVAIYTSYPDEKEMLLRLIYKIFKYKAPISIKKAGYNVRYNFEVRINSKKLAESLMTEYGIPGGSKSFTVRLPKAIFEADTILRKAFLRGVIDGDGSITKWGVKIVSGSTNFLNDLKRFLSNLQIHTGSIIKEHDRNTYSIRVNKKEDWARIRGIYNSGFSYKRKKESINKI